MHMATVVAFMQLVMAALRSRCGHYIYSAKKLKLRRVLETLCGAFERCSRVRYNSAESEPIWMKFGAL